MTNFEQWARRHPLAAKELSNLFEGVPWPHEQPQPAGSEAAAQQAVRFAVSQAGGMSWRNNVGATPAKCPDCGTPRQPVRYGLSNDSHQLNKVIKSSDLILAIPRLITPEMVGIKIAQFGSVEVKAPGWKGVRNEHERAQEAWLTLINRLGGFAQFSTGEIQL